MNNRARAVDIALHQISALFQYDKNPRAKSFRVTKLHRVYLSFVRQANGWHCRFHQDNLARTPLSRQFIFRSQEKIFEIVRRGRGLASMEPRRVLDEAVAIGRGGTWLELDEKQYEALRHQS